MLWLHVPFYLLTDFVFFMAFYDTLALQSHTDVFKIIIMTGLLAALQTFYMLWMRSIITEFKTDTDAQL